MNRVINGGLAGPVFIGVRLKINARQIPTTVQTHLQRAVQQRIPSLSNGRSVTSTVRTARWSLRECFTVLVIITGRAQIRRGQCLFAI